MTHGDSQWPFSEESRIVVSAFLIAGFAFVSPLSLHGADSDSAFLYSVPDVTNRFREPDDQRFQIVSIRKNPIAPLGVVPDWVDDTDLRSFTRDFDVREWSRGRSTRFRLRGRIEEDTLVADQTAANRATFGNLPDRSALRRARIGAEGNFTPDSRYVFEIDVASGQVVLRDGYVGAGNVTDTGEFQVGHMREPFSLEGATSSNTFALMERSPINSLDPARNWGVGYSRYSSTNESTVAVGLFQSGTDPSDVQFGVGSDTALTAKFTKLAGSESNGERLMHCGLAVSERVPDFGIVVISQKPASPLLDLADSSASPFVPTIKIPANFQQLVNLQWAVVNGSFWAEAEWYGSIIDQRAGGPVFLHGSYVDIGYFFTGEKRNYVNRTGAFGPIAVKRPAVLGFASATREETLGHGAWELTARMSYLDCLDVNPPLGPNGQTVGITLPQATIGVNWYLADRLRVMFNYSYFAPFEANTGTSGASVFGTRLAMFW